MLLRIPPFLRTPLLLVFLLTTHLLFPGATESARLLMLRVLASPVSFAAGGAAPPALPEASRTRIGAWREEVRSPFGARRDRLFPVLDLDRAKGWLIVGGGADAGIEPGCRVAVPAALIGIVDQVTANLARVRLTSARDFEVPVETDPGGRALPGNLDRLVGILRGTGEGAYVAQAHLPRAFRLGDVLRTLAADDGSTWPVGRITKEGVHPRVRLAHGAEGAGLVFVETSEGARHELESLFRSVDLDVVLEGCARVRGAIVTGAGAGDLLPGCAVHAQGWYVGRVLRVAFGMAHVAGADDPDERIEVRILGDGGAVGAELIGRGRGRFDAFPRSSPLPRGRVDVVTAGGQELVPAGLFVGSGSCEGRTLTLSRPDDWPARVRASVFRFGPQRRKLSGGRR